MTKKPASMAMHPGPGFRIQRTIERPDKKILEQYELFESADISDILNRMYTMSSDIHNLVDDSSIVGPACTVKVFPGDNLMVHKALDLAKPGDIVVVDASESYVNAVMGDLIASKAKIRGIQPRFSSR